MVFLVWQNLSPANVNTHCPQENMNNACYDPASEKTPSWSQWITVVNIFGGQEQLKTKRSISGNQI